MFDRKVIASGDPKRRNDMLSIMEAALRAVDPYGAVRERVKRRGNALTIGPNRYDLGVIQRVSVVGAGKASARMAQAVEEILGDRIAEGWVNVRYGYGARTGRIHIHEAGHPIPDENGVVGTKEILRIAERVGKDDLLVVLISGGGSALLVEPAAGIDLRDIQATNRLLLESGASIGEINAVRKHLSRVKGGQLAKAAYPATIVSLILSDVIGSPLDVIASGPTVPDSSTYRDAWNVLAKYNLLDKIPRAVRKRLERGINGLEQETPKPGDEVFSRSYVVLVGDNRVAAEAAVEEASLRGYKALLLTTFLEGEAREAGKFVASLAKEELASSKPLPLPACLVMGGETTVTVLGDGLGGRNQELALSAAIAMESFSDGVLIASLGTDGTDGPTDAAGGIVDSRTVERGKAAGLSAVESLANNDSYTFLKAAAGLLVTGPTMTNVNDLVLVCVYRRDEE